MLDISKNLLLKSKFNLSVRKIEVTYYNASVRVFTWNTKKNDVRTKNQTRIEKGWKNKLVGSLMFCCSIYELEINKA